MPSINLDRRGFLGQLARLPLIGGDVTLIGTPTAATPVTPRVFAAYDEWLDAERSWLKWEMYGPEGHKLVPHVAQFECIYRDRLTRQLFDYRPINSISTAHSDKGDSPSSRAAVILAAAGATV